MSTVRRSRRSELATPASNEWMFQKAARIGADLVFLDLEDAVAPQEKERSREKAARAFNELDWGTTVRAIRMNGIDTPWAYGDVVTVLELAPHTLDTIIVPKVRAARDVWWVDVLLTQLEAGLHRERPVRLEVLIEEVEGLENAFEIAKASRRLDALIFGAGDYSGSQGARVDHSLKPKHPYPGELWHYARFRVAAAARAGGLKAVDAPFPDFEDPAGYQEQCHWAATVGFDGKWAIHPNQVSLANEVFSPSEEEIAHAKRLVDAEADAVRQGLGASSLDGHLIDAGSARLARTVLARAEDAGLV